LVNYIYGNTGETKFFPIYGFQTKVGIKYETDKFIYAKNNKLHQFHRKWTIIIPL